MSQDMVVFMESIKKLVCNKTFAKFAEEYKVKSGEMKAFYKNGLKALSVFSINDQ